MPWTIIRGPEDPAWHRPLWTASPYGVRKRSKSGMGKFG